MKTSLDHLPDGKRAELSQVLEVLFREFEDVIRRKGGARQQGRILKVILFGSYPAATGSTIPSVATNPTTTC